jgi:hypothetical protein
MRRFTTAALVLATSFVGTACIEGYETRGPRQTGTETDDDEMESVREDEKDCKAVEPTNGVMTIDSVSDFAANVPRNGACWDLYGTLRIQGTAITSVAELGGLRSVNHLEVVDTALTTWDSKRTVEVYGNLLIDGNDNLTGIANMSLERWPENNEYLLGLTLTDNRSLTDIGTLAYTKELDTNLRVEDNAALTSISFRELRIVKGEVKVVSNNALKSLDFNSLGEVGAAFTLRMNAKLESFSASELELAKDMSLLNNPKLRTIDPFTDLSSVGIVTIDDNDSLQNLSGFSYLQIVTQLVLKGNAQLSDISGVYGWSSIFLGARVTDNPALPTCKVQAIATCVGSMGGNMVNERNATDANPCPTVTCQ